MGIFFKNFGKFRGRHPARTNAAAPLPKRACGAGCKRMAFLISLRIARSATFLKSQRISGYERISGHEKSLPVSQHRSTLLLPPDRQGFSDFCAGSASALKLRTRGARPGARHLRRNWVQGVSPGRGEPAPLPATSGGIGSRASALVAGSPLHYPSPPAELGPGRQPWG